MYRGWERERGGQRGIISIYLSQKKTACALVFPEVAVSAPKDRTHIGSVR